MQTQALLEQLSDHRFRVTGSGQLALSAEGATQEEAVANFQRIAIYTLRNAKLITIEVPVETTSESPSDNSTMNNQALLDSIGGGAALPEEDWQEYLQTLQQLREEDNARVSN